MNEAGKAGKENNEGNRDISIRRRVLAFATIAGVPLFGGALLAPYIFNMLMLLGRNIGGMQSLRGLEFESVVTRCMLVLAFISLWPAMSILGSPGRQLGRLFQGPRRLKDLLFGFILGIVTMAVVPLAGVAFGAYLPAEELGGIFLKGLLFLGTAVLVAFLEELLFRGIIFGLLKELIGVGRGAVLGGLLFAMVHFIQPIIPPGIVHGHWYSGFMLLWKAIVSFDPTRYALFPYSLTLFLIGVSLCLVYAKRGNLYMAAGIHAGWILVLKLAGELLARTDSDGWLFGNDMVVAKSYGALIVALLFLVAVAWQYRTWIIHEKTAKHLR